MKKIPYLGICIGCGILAVLVAARCGVTAGREMYYGTDAVWRKICGDPWFYVGVLSAAMSLGAGAILWWEKKTAKNQENEEETQE